MLIAYFQGGSNSAIPIDNYITTIPSQKGSLSYAGEILTPEWSDYDSNKLIIGGTTSAIEAGEYIATFRPRSNYAWSDGSRKNIEVTWKISKDIIITKVPSTEGNSYDYWINQIPLWHDYSSTQLTKNGDTITRGYYGYQTASFTPNEGYAWSEQIQTKYSINKYGTLKITFPIYPVPGIVPPATDRLASNTTYTWNGAQNYSVTNVDWTTATFKCEPSNYVSSVKIIKNSYGYPTLTFTTTSNVASNSSLRIYLIWDSKSDSIPSYDGTQGSWGIGTDSQGGWSGV